MSNHNHEFNEMLKASLRSVGTACTMASIGMYLHRRGFIVGEGKRTLALISQQVTFPLLFFTKIVYCNQNWSTEPCPSVTDTLSKVWMILLWPIYVCSCGIAVGYMITKIFHLPQQHLRCILVSCGFANSTALPIILLTVIHDNFPSTCQLGRVDPTLFLSVYLILYPVLQWGIGGWILCPDDNDDNENDTITADPKDRSNYDNKGKDSKHNHDYNKKENVEEKKEVIGETNNTNEQQRKRTTNKNIITSSATTTKQGSSTTTATSLLLPTGEDISHYIRTSSSSSITTSRSLPNSNLLSSSPRSTFKTMTGGLIDISGTSLCSIPEAHSTRNVESNNNVNKLLSSLKNNDKENNNNNEDNNNTNKNKDEENGIIHHELTNYPHNNNNLNITHNVLNNAAITKFYKHLHNGIHDTDASLYISEVNLQNLLLSSQSLSSSSSSSSQQQTFQEALARAGISVDSQLDQLEAADNSDESTTGSTSKSTSPNTTTTTCTSTSFSSPDRSYLLMIESDDSETEISTPYKSPQSSSSFSLSSPTSSSSNHFFIPCHSQEQNNKNKSKIFANTASGTSLSEQTPLLSFVGSTTTSKEKHHHHNENATSHANIHHYTHHEEDDVHDHHHHGHHRHQIAKIGMRRYQNEKNISKQKKKQRQRRQFKFQQDTTSTIITTIIKIFNRFLQPPVIGAISGIIVASIPWLRGLFVDIIHRSDSAPLEFIFDGLYSIGQAAVPINMIILGSNLSSSGLLSIKTFTSSNKTKNSSEIDTKTILCIVFGKLVLMPIIGIISCIILKHIWDIPSDIEASFYLVLMIVFITPTANNVMVMVELSGAGTKAKEGMAKIIGFQYIFAPILLSLSVTGVVHVASQWMDTTSLYPDYGYGL